MKTKILLISFFMQTVALSSFALEPEQINDWSFYKNFERSRACATNARERSKFL